MSEYTEQAEQFAKKHDLTMTADYLGHFPRLGDTATANYRITLSRPGKRPMSFDFSNSINDSWKYTEDYNPKAARQQKGLPPKMKQEYWPKAGAQVKLGRYLLIPDAARPSLYDVLACITKSEVGTFEDFCADYSYDEDSRKAFDTYQAVLKEWGQVSALFGDCLEELQEIN